jgi:hypothetical protein
VITIDEFGTDCYFNLAGAMQFFKKLDIGPLDIGDYLGKTFMDPIYFSSFLRIYFGDLTLLFYHFQQLVPYLLQQILFAHCRCGAYQSNRDISILKQMIHVYLYTEFVLFDGAGA